MFSRSDKSEEANEEVSFESEERQRSPMLLAALAGLLAVAGAILLVRYLSTTDDTGAAAAAETNERQVLVLNQDLASGTRVDDILETPTTYLTARAVPENFISASAITTIQELEDLRGQVLDGTALQGEQLLRGRFIDPSDFSGDGLIEREAGISVPPGHHTVVVSLPSDQALGGNLAGGEKVAVISSFRHDPEGDAEPFEVSVVVLPAVEVIAAQTTAEIVGTINEDNSLGTATVGEVFVTLAVEPDELTDLTFAMKYGDIILAGALDSSDEEDPRPLTTLQAIIDRSTFIDSEGAIEALEAIAAEDEALAPLSEEDGEDGADGEGEGDEPEPEADAPSDEAPADDAPAEGEGDGDAGSDAGAESDEGAGGAPADPGPAPAGDAEDVPADGDIPPVSDTPPPDPQDLSNDNGALPPGGN